EAGAAKEGSGLLRHAVRLGGATGLSHVLVLLAAPFVTRLYTPKDFGDFGIIVSFAAMTSVAVSLRYDFAIPTARTDEEAAVLLRVSLALALPMSCVLAASMFGLQLAHIEPFVGLPKWSALVVAPMLIVLGCVSALRLWCVRESNFDAVARALLAQGVGRAILPIALAHTISGFLGLAVAELVGRSLGVVSMLRAMLRRITPLRRGETHASAIARRHRKFPLIVLPSSLVDAIGTSLPLFIVGALYGQSMAGQFVLVSQVAMVPGALIGATIGDIFYSEFARATRTEKAAVATILSQYARRLAAISVTIYVVSALLAPIAFPFVFGEEWRTAGKLFILLAPYLALSLLASPLSRALLAVNHQELKFAIDAMLLIFPPLTLWALREKSTIVAFGGYSLANACVYAVYLLLIFWAVRKWLRDSSSKIAD
ncbi:MAG TPA: oligosaccharide flippase family protein, partial [Candidatus Cybelea sp.]|nr:oligosaccharide flippase family protein [Candidatus Cybelea sp.]